MNTYRAAVTLKHEKCHNNGSRWDFVTTTARIEIIHSSVFCLIYIHLLRCLFTRQTLLPLRRSVVWSSQAVPVKGTGGESTASQLDWHAHIYTPSSTYLHILCWVWAWTHPLIQTQWRRRAFWHDGKRSPLLYNAENYTTVYSLTVQADFHFGSKHKEKSPEHQSVTGL